MIMWFSLWFLPLSGGILALFVFWRAVVYVIRSARGEIDQKSVSRRE